jgi:anti-sigma regulatory factor (Ser/Thr protein kinase)
VSESVAWSLPASAESAAAARDAVRSLALGFRVESIVTLLVTELVTNSVRHADMPDDSELELRIEPMSSRLLAEVCDSGSGFHVRDAVQENREVGGLGLLLVDRLSDSWGIERAQDSTCVWFELDLEREAA